jgi:WD40 repeat protein
MRTLASIESGQIHGGSINFLTMTQTGHIVTGSADKTVKVFDLKSGLKKPLMTYKCTDAVFCGDVVANRIITVGTGDGNLLAFDLQGRGQECLYGYGCD